MPCRLTSYRSEQNSVPNLEMLVTAEECGVVWIENLIAATMLIFRVHYWLETRGHKNE